MDVPVALRDRGEAAPLGLAAGRERCVTTPVEVKVTTRLEEIGAGRGCGRELCVNRAQRPAPWWSVQVRFRDADIKPTMPSFPEQRWHQPGSPLLQAERMNSVPDVQAALFKFKYFADSFHDRG